MRADNATMSYKEIQTRYAEASHKSAAGAAGRARKRD